MPCRHCGKRKPIRSRGLCWPCYKHHRDEYPPLPSGERSANPQLPRCVGCNREAPSAGGLRQLGWRSRNSVAFGVPIKEVHCPDCFAAHGWGDELCRDSASIAALHPGADDEVEEPGTRYHRISGAKRSWSMGMRI